MDRMLVLESNDFGGPSEPLTGRGRILVTVSEQIARSAKLSAARNGFSPANCPVRLPRSRASFSEIAILNEPPARETPAPASIGNCSSCPVVVSFLTQERSKPVSNICVSHSTLPDIRTQTVITVAASAVRPPPSFYPGAPLSIDYLERPWTLTVGAPVVVPTGDEGGRGRTGQEDWGEYPWSFSRERPHYRAQNYMSQAPSKPGSPTNTQPRSTREAHIHSNAAATNPYTTAAQAGAYTATNPASLIQSPAFYGQQNLQESSAQAGSRSLGVQSILNPSQPDTADTISGQPSYNAASSAQRQEPTPGTFLTGPAASPRSLKRNQRAAQADESTAPSRSSGPRRTLTPISPGRRGNSFGGRRNLTGPTTSGQQTPLAPAGSRVYTAEPGTHAESDIPPLPAPTGGRGYFQESRTPEGPGYSKRQYNTTADTTRGGRRSESPGTSQSSYSQISQPSPIFSYGAAPVSQQGYQPLQPAPSGSTMHSLSAGGFAEGHPVAGQGALQMTLNTDQGTMVVPVDVQQASRTANEKRKRNASASARFRARRKEKEKEASHTIVSLEKEIRDLAEERDFYRRERDFFRELVSRNPDAHQVPGRPASPRSRRSTLLPPMGADRGPTQFQEQFREPNDLSSRAPVRRRTGESRRGSGPRMSASPMLPPQIPFSSQHPLQAPVPPPGPLPPLPSPFTDPRILPPGPPPQPTVTRSQSYDPFRSERFDRGWNPGR